MTSRHDKAVFIIHNRLFDIIPSRVGRQRKLEEQKVNQCVPVEEKASKNGGGGSCISGSGAVISGCRLILQGHHMGLIIGTLTDRLLMKGTT